MSYATDVTPIDSLIGMLVASQTVRAIMANPYATKDELAAILDAGAVAEGDTADRIAYGELEDDPESSGYIEKPRGYVDQNEESLTESGGLGFNENGELYARIECPIPPSLLTDPDGARRDADYKLKWIMRDVMRLPRQYPYLANAAMSGVHGVGRLSDPKAHGEGDTEQYQILDFTVTYR